MHLYDCDLIYIQQVLDVLGQANYVVHQSLFLSAFTAMISCLISNNIYRRSCTYNIIYPIVNMMIHEYLYLVY